uniref:T-cell immunomodulatory protein n=1 Tax=Plectus sambesii TaxID=2011161 RepID=A0A914VR73_9BILA
MLFFAIIVVASSLALSTSAKEDLEPTVGKICAFADFDRDKYTDLLIVNQDHIFVRLQNEDGEFKDGQDYLFIKKPNLPDYFTQENIVSCAVGDFDGNSHADILITSRRKSDGLAAAVCYLQPKVGFNCTMLGGESADGELLSDQPIVVDVNADGISDILAFVTPKDNGSPIKCFRGQNGQRKFDDCSAVFKDFNSKLNTNFPHAFVDVDDDLSAELVFGVNDSLGLEVWKREGDNEKWAVRNIINALPATDDKIKYGQPIFGDVNADGQMDILLPRCDGSNSDQACKLRDMLVWEMKTGWNPISVTVEPYKIVADGDGIVQLRIGDFDLDGFPDLVTVLKDKDDQHELFIFKNVPCDETPDCKNLSRTFKLEEKPRLIESPDISSGKKMMAAFFDLREDGSLDVLVEYETKEKVTQFNFIPCEDKGDTTFLKVEVFTKICYQDCKDSGDSGENRYGSSISWHGTSLKYTMSDTSGDQRHGVQTQMAQTSHRTLQLPYATFGLGRSPNFVDTLIVGTPSYPSGPEQKNHWTQLVPNARMYIIPPGPDGNGVHGWVSRLYMTPSRLIIQSLIVLVAVCGIIVVIIAFLHWRERKQDLVERQAQAHRFHFDAM